MAGLSGHANPGSESPVEALRRARRLTKATVAGGTRRDLIWYALLPWECCWWRHPFSWLRHGRPYGDPLFWQFWLWRREALYERKRSNYWMEKHDELLVEVSDLQQRLGAAREAAKEFYAQIELRDA